MSQENQGENMDLDLSGVFGDAAVAIAERPDPATPTIPITGLEKTLANAVDSVTTAKGGRKTRSVKQPVFFDLETVPDESRMELFGLDPVPAPRQQTPTDQLPDPVALVTGKVDEIKKKLDGLWPPLSWIHLAMAAEEKIEKPRKGVLDLLSSLGGEVSGESEAIAGATSERNKLLSVTPEFNRIVAIGYSVGVSAGETESQVVGETYAINGKEYIREEADLLEVLWNLLESASIVVGYNIAGFDLPTLFVRSALLGVKPTRRFDLRPWGGEVVDLMQARYPKGPSRKLKELARVYGFAVPAGEVDGSQVLGMFKAGQFNQIAAYVRSDVEVSRRLYEFYRGYFC
jgi:hypothetical protein